MPTKGVIKKDVQIGTFVANGIFDVVKDLHPEILVRLKFPMEKQCRHDMVEQKLTVPNNIDSIIKEPLPILNRPVLPLEDDAFVCETVPGSDTVSATSQINKIKETLRVLIRNFRDVLSLLSGPL